VRARRSPGIAVGDPFRGEFGRVALRRGAGIQVLNPAPIAVPGARPEADRAGLRPPAPGRSASAGRRLSGRRPSRPSAWEYDAAAGAGRWPGA
jgi:hypothetical protein